MATTVLLVDDERLVTEALVRALSKEPFQVLVAESGHEALRIMARQPIDAIVADEKMPGMRGIELLSIVHQQYPDTVRILLTGYATLENAIRAINECHIHRFFTKPCSDDELATTLRAAIEQKLIEQGAKDVARILESGADPGDCLVPPGRGPD